MIWNDTHTHAHARCMYPFTCYAHSHACNTCYAHVIHMDRCGYIHSLGLGLGISLVLYRVFALSVLSYVCQLAYAPSWVRAKGSECLEKLLRGPWRWISTAALHSLDVVAGFPTGFPS